MRIADRQAGWLVGREDPTESELACRVPPISCLRGPGQPSVGNRPAAALHDLAHGHARRARLAVVHCTGGDILIAFSSLLLSLVLTGSGEWPRRRFGRVAALAVGFGVGYTIFSEWLNIVVRKSWQYSELMPVVPFIDTGLSPLLQWIIIPSLGL